MRIYISMNKKEKAEQTGSKEIRISQWHRIKDKPCAQFLIYL